jgi:hypothetical protein
MGLDKTLLPDSLLRCVSAADRKAAGLPVPLDQSLAAAVTRNEHKREKELQCQIANFLRLRGIWFDQDAMHKRRTGTLSAPDFQFPYRGKFVAWEVKLPGAKLDDGQIKARDSIIAQGGEWRLITALPEAMEHIAYLECP